MRLIWWTRATVAALGILGSFVGPSLAQDIPRIRFGYVLPPSLELAGVFSQKADVTRHLNKTYTFEPIFFRAPTLVVTAFAAGEIDVGDIGYAPFNEAVVNAGLDDLRVIADEAEDGVPGYFSAQVRVGKDAGINTINDLKGRVVATIAIGSAADIGSKYMLRRHGLEPNRDYTIIEAGFATMKPMLLEKKVDAAYFAQPFAMDAELNERTKTLFTMRDAMEGPAMVNFVAARSSFVAQHRAALVDFIEDYLRVAHWFYDPANRPQAIQIASQASKIPPTVLDTFMFTTKDNFRNPDGVPDLQAIQANMRALKEVGLARVELQMGKFADLSLVREAAARIKENH